LPPVLRFGLAQFLLVSHSMKRAAFKLDTTKGGWIRTTIAPLNDVSECRFGIMDTVMFCGLMISVVFVARILLAH